MMTVEQVRLALIDRRIPMVAAATGLSEFAIIKIREGSTKNPTYNTMALLSDYLGDKKNPTEAG